VGTLGRVVSATTSLPTVIAEYPEVVGQLRAVYDKWWIRVQSRFVNEEANQQYEQTKGKAKAERKRAAEI